MVHKKQLSKFVKMEPITITIPEEESWRKLTRKYGDYGVDWWFESRNTIKYFK